jgi:hypothetical protein
MKGSSLSDCSIYVSSLKGEGWEENEVAGGGGREADRTGKRKPGLESVNLSVLSRG